MRPIRPRLLAAFSVIPELLLFSCAGAPGSHADGAAGAESLSRFLEVEGISAHLLDTAAVRPDPGTRTPLLLVHGWMGSSHDFEPLLAALPAELRVIVPDLPGSGRTQKRGVDYRLGFFLDFLKGTLDELGIPKVVLVGHSLGGMLAVQFTHRYPERVERLVLIAPAGLSGEDEKWRYLSSSKLLVNLLTAMNNRLAVWISMRQNVFYDPSFATSRRVEEIAQTALSPEGRSAQAQITLNILGRHPVDELLPAVAVPVLVVWGANDRVLDPGWGKQFVLLTPRARLVKIPESGHLPQIEAPLRTARAILAFLDGRGESTAR